MFQHLYLLGRSATRKQLQAAREWLKFQHLYLLGRSATTIDLKPKKFNDWFQHLYLLGRSATAKLGLKLSTTLRFNTFTFWEGLRLNLEN